MSFKISEVCDINSFNLSKNDNLNAINYLDTANLNVGTVDELQYMEVGKDKIPSRAKRVVRKNDNRNERTVRYATSLCARHGRHREQSAFQAGK